MNIRDTEGIIHHNNFNSTLVVPRCYSWKQLFERLSAVKGLEVTTEEVTCITCLGRGAPVWDPE